MKLIVGLGNPGTKYKNNRHNLGFKIVDEFATVKSFKWQFSKDWICKFAKSDTLIVIKPDTFMNNSGSAVADVANFFKIDSEDILIVYDEVDLPFGKVRLAFNGLSAGHKGIDSIIKGLGGVDFSRLRVGIGRPSATDGRVEDVADFVLKDFNNDEKKELPGLIQKSLDAIDSYVADGIDATMNRFN